MGAVGGALLGRTLGRAAGNIFNGRPVFSNLFGSRSSAPRQSTQQYGAPTPLPSTPFSYGGEFSGKPFGNAPMGTGTFAPGNTGQGVTYQQPKSGLGSMLSGVGDAVGGAFSGIGNLFNGIGGNGAGNGSAQPATSTPSQPKSGLTGSQFGTGGENPNGEGVSADWTAPALDGVAGPDLFGNEIYNAAK